MHGKGFQGYLFIYYALYIKNTLGCQIQVTLTGCDIQDKMYTHDNCTQG